MAPSLKPESRWFDPKAASNPLNPSINPPAHLAHQKAPVCVVPPIGYARPIVTPNKIILDYSGPIALLCLNMAMSGLKDT
jgi:hypothetical protein